MKTEVLQQKVSLVETRSPLKVEHGCVYVYIYMCICIYMFFTFIHRICISYIYIFVHIHICLHTFTYIVNLHANIVTYIDMYIHTHIYIYLHIFTWHTHVYIYMLSYRRIDAYMCVSICICIYIYDIRMYTTRSPQKVVKCSTVRFQEKPRLKICIICPDLIVYYTYEFQGFYMQIPYTSRKKHTLDNTHLWD